MEKGLFFIFRTTKRGGEEDKKYKQYAEFFHCCVTCVSFTLLDGYEKLGVGCVLKHKNELHIYTAVTGLMTSENSPMKAMGGNGFWKIGGKGD